VGHEGDIFRFNLFHLLAMVLVLSVLTLAKAYVPKRMLL
jgi:lactate permease